MKRLNLDTIKKSSGIRERMKLGSSQRLFGAQVPGSTQSEQEEGPLLRITLHGMYLGHHFDGGTRGNTGEFYWYSTFADGNDLMVVDSRQSSKFGRNGILTGVGSNTWLDVGLLELFRSQEPTQRENIVFTFSLMESDNGDEAKAIFKEAAGIAKIVAKRFAGVDIPDAEKKATNLVNTILEADGDDQAIYGIKGLDYITNYDVGRFIKLRGKSHDRRPTYAVCSVLPLVDPGTNDFAFYEEKNNSIQYGKEVTHTVEIPQDGYLSIFMKVKSGRDGIRLTGKGGKRLTNFTGSTVKTIPVQKGNYPITLMTPLYPSRADLQVMFTSKRLRERYT